MSVKPPAETKGYQTSPSPATRSSLGRSRDGNPLAEGIVEKDYAPAAEAVEIQTPQTACVWKRGNGEDSSILDGEVVVDAGG